MDRSDKALLAAFLLAAGLGTWTHCLMHDDGAVILSSGWLGSLWDLYASQIASRAAAVLAMHGPAWLARDAFDLDAGAYLTLAHVLYFAVPLVLWLVLRAVERDRLFSRLYLSLALAMIYFPTELIFGVGLWLIWLALVSDPARSTAGVVLATLLLGAVMAFTHPALALMGLFFVAAGLVLPLFGQRLPTRSLVAVAVLSVALLAFYLVAARWLPPTNPTDGAVQETNRFAYLSPVWMLKTLVYFPMIAVLWFLLLVPGADTLRLRWRFLPLAVLAVAAFGLWCAAAGTGLKTGPWARHTGLYVVALALVLALPAPAAWLKHAERPLILFAAIVATSALSFNIDLWLFGRFIDREFRPGIVDAGAVAFQAIGAGGGPHSFQVWRGRGIRPGRRDAELRLVSHTARLLHLLSLRPARRVVSSIGRRRRVATLRMPGRRTRPRSCPGRQGPAIPGISRSELLRWPARRGNQFCFEAAVAPTLSTAGDPQLRRRKDTHLAGDAGHDLDHMLELLACVDGAKRAAQQRHAVGRGRRHGDVDVDASLQHGAPETDGGHAIGQVNTHHRAVLGTEDEALVLEPVIERRDIVPELLAQLGPRFHHAQGLAYRGHDRGRQ
jgi:hypothetical protein